MRHYRTAFVLVVALSVTCSGQIALRFNNDARIIRDVLMDAHVSGSLVFSGGCKFQDRTASVPAIARRRDLTSPRETLEHMLSINSGMRVTRDSDGLIRMVEAGVPTDILDVKIRHISFDSANNSGPSWFEFRGWRKALLTILWTPEVQGFRKEHNIASRPKDGRIEGFQPGADSPDVHGELNDVTLSQALDYVLKTFPGYWVYEDASCKDGSREVGFEFY